MAYMKAGDKNQISTKIASDGMHDIMTMVKTKEHIREIIDAASSITRPTHISSH